MALAMKGGEGKRLTYLTQITNKKLFHSLGR
jgi:hypothetical protein